MAEGIGRNGGSRAEKCSGIKMVRNPDRHHHFCTHRRSRHDGEAFRTVPEPIAVTKLPTPTYEERDYEQDPTGEPQERRQRGKTWKDKEQEDEEAKEHLGQEMDPEKAATGNVRAACGRNGTRGSGWFQELHENETSYILRAASSNRKANHEERDELAKETAPALKLAITLRFLATVQDSRSLDYAFRVGHNTVSLLIREVCAAIVAEFSYLIPCPNTKEEWLNVSRVFAERWNFEHCLGAVDGKHIAIKRPKHGGSIYYNYKRFHSIILMAIVDADYNFMWVDIGANGSAGDAQVFNNSEIKQVIEADRLGIPDPEPLPGDDKDMPYFFIGDDAFALKQWMMKPYSKRNMTVEQRIYNYRLSRGRRIVENGFGILAHRFRRLLHTLQQVYRNVVTITMACVTLHNYLRKKNIREYHVSAVDREDENHDVIPGEWRKNYPLLDGEIVKGNRQSTAAKYQRDYLCAYYNSDVGAVS